MVVNAGNDITRDYLPLPHQLSLQAVDLEEGGAGAESADWPDGSNRPAARPGHSAQVLDLLHSVFTGEASCGIAATAEGKGFGQTPIQRWGLPQRPALQVPMGGGLQRRHHQTGSWDPRSDPMPSYDPVPGHCVQCCKLPVAGSQVGILYKSFMGNGTLSSKWWMVELDPSGHREKPEQGWLITAV